MPTASKDQAGWQVAHTIAGAGEKTITFKTENRFVDADARVVVTTPSASNPSLSLTDKSTGLSMGTATNGVYSPEIDVSGKATIQSGGWIDADDYTVSATGLKVGTINQSTILNGQSTVADGTTIVPGPSEQTISITEGYNSARSIIIGSASSSSPGEATSGNATISTLQYAYVSANQEYTITGNGDVSAPTINTAGYLSGSVGTLNANPNGAAVSATVPAITLGTVLSGTTGLKTPALQKQTISITGVTDASDGNATTSTPSSGAFVAIRSNANSGTISATPSIEAAGYGDGTNFISGTVAEATVGAAQSPVYYVPIKSGSIRSETVEINMRVLSPSYESSRTRFIVQHSADNPAPDVISEGYVSSTIGTKLTSLINIEGYLGVIGIKANLSGTGTKAPSITKDSATNISVAGTATTTQPSSGHYIAVSSAANTDTVTATASVTTAGYGNTSYYNSTDSDPLTVGAAASATTYIPISDATFANSGTAGVTYTDISSSAPVLISGDYLYINEGYTTNQKISLARLVPDATGDNAPANYILAGYTAYDNDGALLVGTMQTYDGTYTIT